MVKSYAKGYRFERNLVHVLSEHGFVVLRAPHSGSMNIASPDIVAIKKTDGSSKVFAIECKNREEGFTVSTDQLNELKEWEEKGGAMCYIAWKCGRSEPIFLTLADVTANKGNVGKKFAAEHGISLEKIRQLNA